MSDQHTGRADVDVLHLFPRIDKRALGAAGGLLVGAAIWLLTVLRLTTGPGGLPLGLLRQYFYGYDVSWPGAFVGFVWRLGQSAQRAPEDVD